MKEKLLLIGWLLLCINARSAATPVVVAEVDSLGWIAVDSASVVQLAKIACQRGLDTTAVFVEAWDSWCRQAMKRCIPSRPPLFQENDSIEEGGPVGQVTRKRVRCIHLFRPVLQTASSSSFERISSQMDSLHHWLVGEKASEPWCLHDEQLCVDTAWIEPSKQPKRLEDGLEQLTVGEWSQPLVTPMGIHLIKILSVETATRDRLCEHRNGVSPEEVQRLKERHHYQPRQRSIDQLIKTGSCQGELFVIDGQSYGLAHYQRYAEAHPAAANSCFNAFVTKSLLDAEAACFFSALKPCRADCDTLEYALPSLVGVRDSLLISLLLEQAVEPHLSHEQELEAWYSAHQEQFRKPVFHGMVLHCVDKKQGRALRKFLRNLPEQERMRAIELLFSEHPQEAPVVEQGVFPQGSHPYVDALMFRGPNPLPYPDRPCTQLVGYKSKAPESYQEVRHDVVSHYRDYLVKQLVEQTNQGNKVEN